MTDKSNDLRKKILIVEDDDISRKVMTTHLKNYYKIDTAKNAEEAVNLFSENDYQLILMDINLGIGKNGIEVMKEIRKTNKGKSIPVIAITAYANFGDRESFLSAGFDNYISKPYQPDDLLRNIMDTISRMEY